MTKSKILQIVLVVIFLWGAVLVGPVVGAPDRATAQEIVREAYLEVLERDPDPRGLETFSRALLEEGRDVAWLKETLATSPEGIRLRETRATERREARRQAVQGFLTTHLHFVLSLCLAIAVGFVISQVYKHTHRGMNFELSFMSTLVLLAPIVSLVMLYIRGDLVLSLGLIGSLSIIRFRTPIKDSRDMVFLFWTIAVGLGAGTYNWSVVIVSSLIMVPLVFLLYYVRYGRSNYADFILVCVGNGDYPSEHIQSIIAESCSDVVTRSHEVDGDVWETVFELRGTDSGRTLLDQVVGKLRAVSCIRKVSLLAPKLDLPV